MYINLHIHVVWVTFGSHSFRTGSSIAEDRVLYCGKCALAIMADPFEDGLFSVFDDDQQTTSTKKTPASLTPDIGLVVVCCFNNVMFVVWNKNERLSSELKRITCARSWRWNRPNINLLVLLIRH